MDVPPEVDDIGVGTIIFFPRGTYVCNETDSEYIRYYQGEVKSVNRTEEGQVTISGHHSHRGKGWKMINNLTHYEFEDIPLDNIRLSPTALDFLEALSDLIED